MRGLLPFLFLVAGCQDYGKLGEDFCKTAKWDGGLVALCDDFEADSIDPSLWQQNVSGGTLEIEHYRGPRVSVDHQNYDAYDGNDPEYAYRGKSALHAVLPGVTAESAQLVETHVTPGSDSGLSVRFFFYSGASVEPGQMDLVRFVGADGTVQRTLSLDAGAARLTDTASGKTQVLGIQVVPQTWHCMEVLESPNEVDLVIDFMSTTQFDLSLSGLPSAAPVTTTQIGPSRMADSTSQPAELWIDEVIMSQHFVGCSI